MMWRQPDDIFSSGSIAVHTTGDDQPSGDIITFPEELTADVGLFDDLVRDLAARAVSREPGDPPRSVTQILERADAKFSPDLANAYDALCRLYDEGRNHIWGYYIRNLSRPFALSRQKIDRLVGNPPWLAYRFMDPSLQKVFKEQAELRGLWTGGKYATHQDLASYFVARSVERFLPVGGRFGFVMPAGALKALQYSGLRSGDWSDPLREINTVDLTWNKPWRLVDVKPGLFPVPPQSSSGSGPTQLPTRCQLWRRTGKEH